MRNGKVAGAVVLALVLAGGTAGAQSRGGGSGGVVHGSSQGPGQTPGKYRLQPLNLHRDALGAEAFASAARARMRNGDCAGALDDFDLALQSATDPTLNRDRGLCHERLGDPYPAIDDYRVYVTAAPDAADAEGIRQRLQRLEMDVYKHSSESTDAPDQGGASGASSGSSGGAKASVSASVTVGDEPKRDAMEEVEHDHDELQSSVRAGTGFGLAPFFSEQKWFTPNSNFGDSTTWSESVGLQVRYSVSSAERDVPPGGRVGALQLDRRGEHLRAHVAARLRAAGAARRPVQ